MQSVSIRLFSCTLIFAIPLCASAGGSSCERIRELQQFDMSECECGKGLSKLPITAPRGMSLVAACGYKNEEFIGVVGEFYFKGMALVTGTVRHAYDSATEGAVRFNAKTTGNEVQFRSAILSLKFDDDPSTIQRFRAPPVSEQSPCVSAVATIKVRLLHVEASYDENEESSIPKVFEVMKVGQYEPCTEQE